MTDTAIHPDEAGHTVAHLMAIITLQNEIARSSIGFDNVMALVVERAMALSGATGAVIELVDGDAMLYRATCGSVASFSGFRIPRAGSLAGRCVRERTPLYAADTACDDRVDRAACQRIGAASMVCIPLFHAGDAVGVLKVVSSECHAFPRAAQTTIGLLADVIAASMHNAREYDAALTLSLEDGLTGLLNRRAFDRQLGQAIARSVLDHRPLSLAMFDLDGLKAANDTLGHAAGDAILRDAGRLLRDTVRGTDACFRLGGDEFAAILPETTEDGARQVVNRYCARIAGAQLGDGSVGVSAGVSGARIGDTPLTLVERADAAMYAHKRSNRAARLAGGSRPGIPVVGRAPTR